MKSKLTEKQKRFCEEYLIDLNATQSAIRSGYSVKTARQIAQRMLTNVDIQSYIQELREQQSKRTEITADMVLKEFAKVGFNSEIECIGRDKIRALELIGQHLGMFTEKVSITKEEEVPKLLEALKEKSPTV